jgi:hypothetical protein
MASNRRQSWMDAAVAGRVTAGTRHDGRVTVMYALIALPADVDEFRKGAVPCSTGPLLSRSRIHVNVGSRINFLSHKY